MPASAPILPGERLVVWAGTVRDWAQARPWLLVVVLAALLGGAGIGPWARARISRRRHRRLQAHAQQVRIVPPPEVDAAGAGLWWANLAGLLRPTLRQRLRPGAPHIALEYRWSGRELRILVWVPGTVDAGSVAAAVHAAWPGASTRIEDAVPPLGPLTPAPDRGSAAHRRLTQEAGAALVPARPAWSPLATRSDHPLDPLRPLVAAGAGLRPQEQACVQILARVASPRRVRQLAAAAAALKSGRPSGGLSPERVLTAALGVLTDLLTPTRSAARPHPATTAREPADPLRERDARSALDKLTGPQWETAIRIGVSHTGTRQTPGPRAGGFARGSASGDRMDRRLAVLTHALASALAVHDGRNRLRRLRLPHPTVVLASRVLRTGFLLSTPELASLAGLPTDVAVPGLDRAGARAVPAPIAVPAGGRATKGLGRAQVGGHAVAVPVVDTRGHVHVLGKTGTGKSTLLTHLILEDVRAGRATILIDPKGDLALDVLDRLPARSASRLVLIDPDQPAGSATFNPLQLRRGADADLLVDNIVAIFAAIFQKHWGPRIDDVMRVACLTVMRYPDPTLITVPPLLNNKQFRAPFTVGLDDPEGLKGFWDWFESTPPQLRAQVIGPVLARLRSFLLRDFVRATIGPARSSFDMGQLLDRGGILIARLPKGQLGEDTARLLGSLVFASVWQAASARAARAETQRQDVAVYVDEAHNILNLSGSVSDMLAEARGYHLGLVLAHQHLGQLARETQLALSANARNKIFFTCSPEDAHQLARHTLPHLDEHDLANLADYTAAARLVVANRETAAFTFTTAPPRAATGERDRLRKALASAALARTVAGKADSAPVHDLDAAGNPPSPREDPGDGLGPNRATSPPERPVSPARARTAKTRRPEAPSALTPAPSGTPSASRRPAGHPTSAKPQAGDPP